MEGHLPEDGIYIYLLLVERITPRQRTSQMPAPCQLQRPRREAIDHHIWRQPQTHGQRYDQDQQSAFTSFRLIVFDDVSLGAARFVGVLQSVSSNAST